MKKNSQILQMPDYSPNIKEDLCIFLNIGIIYSDCKIIDIKRSKLNYPFTLIFNKKIRLSSLSPSLLLGSREKYIDEVFRSNLRKYI
jgi:hypothetical protein